MSSVPTIAEADAIAELDDEQGRPYSSGLVARVARSRVADLWIVGVLAVIVIVFGITGQGFFSVAAWLSMSLYAVSYILLAAGQTFVIISGGIDLSDGATLGFSAMGSAFAMQQMTSVGIPLGWVILVGVIVALLLGCLIGLINGLLITKAGISPFVATLAMLGAVTGATSLVNDGLDITNVPAQLGTVGSTFLGGWLPIEVIVAAVITAVAWWVLSRTSFGTWTYAVGSSRDAAERCGIPVARQLIKIYMLSGLLAGVAGLAYLARFTAASPIAGQDYELAAIAAVVIGGANLTGGRGRMLGTVVGTAIISVLVTGLVVANVETFWQEVATGAIIAAAVWADQLRSRLATR